LSGKLEVASGTDNRIDGSSEGASQQHRGGVEGKSVEAADPPSSSPGTFGSVAGRSPVVEAVTFGLGEAVFFGPETTIVVDDDDGPPPGSDASAGAGGGGGGDEVTDDRETGDAMIRVPEATLVRDDDEIVYVATPTRRWHDQRQTKIMFGLFFLFLAALSTGLGVGLIRAIPDDDVDDDVGIEGDDGGSTRPGGISPSSSSAAFPPSGSSPPSSPATCRDGMMSSAKKVDAGAVPHRDSQCPWMAVDGSNMVRIVRRDGGGGDGGGGDGDGDGDGDGGGGWGSSFDVFFLSRRSSSNENGEWEHVNTLAVDDLAISDDYGCHSISVSMSGNTAFVGFSYAYDERGAVFVYERKDPNATSPLFEDVGGGGGGGATCLPGIFWMARQRRRRYGVRRRLRQRRQGEYLPPRSQRRRRRRHHRKEVGACEYDRRELVSNFGKYNRHERMGLRALARIPSILRIRRRRYYWKARFDPGTDPRRVDGRDGVERGLPRILRRCGGGRIRLPSRQRVE
jgi:hypothetical protein